MCKYPLSYSKISPPGNAALIAVPIRSPAVEFGEVGKNRSSAARQWVSAINYRNVRIILPNHWQILGVRRRIQIEIVALQLQPKQVRQARQTGYITDVVSVQVEPLNVNQTRQNGNIFVSPAIGVMSMTMLFCIWSDVRFVRPAAAVISMIWLS